MSEPMTPERAIRNILVGKNHEDLLHLKVWRIQKMLDELDRLRTSEAVLKKWVNLGGAPSGTHCLYEGYDPHEIYGPGYIDSDGDAICATHYIRDLGEQVAALIKEREAQFEECREWETAAHLAENQVVEKAHEIADLRVELERLRAAVPGTAKAIPTESSTSPEATAEDPGWTLEQCGDIADLTVEFLDLKRPGKPKAEEQAMRDIIERVMTQHWDLAACPCWVCVEGNKAGCRPRPSHENWRTEGWAEVSVPVKFTGKAPMLPYRLEEAVEREQEQAIPGLPEGLRIKALEYRRVFIDGYNSHGEYVAELEPIAPQGKPTQS